ncbi:hypothetical protein M0805_004598 [Coniferiporia weirii]|nr:hypothetical protein M0805_004598 [Coniferiporia weirii]
MAKSTRSYEVVKGFFVQDESFDISVAVPARLGLIDSSADRWPKLLAFLEKLNADAPNGVTYKLIIAGRHGQGFHNLAELKYGTKVMPNVLEQSGRLQFIFSSHWAKLDGDGEIVWGPDPLLTALGEDQARDVQAVWKQEIDADVPLPDKLYCSPMTRALQTCRLTFSGVIDFAERKPLILENCREVYGVHSCDQRRSLSYLHESFPEFDIEEGFTEEDELHDPKVREEQAHVAERVRLVLDYIFERDEELVISITAHSGFINGLVEITNHDPVALTTGGVLPMVVKCTIT